MEKTLRHTIKNRMIHREKAVTVHPRVSESDERNPVRGRVSDRLREAARLAEFSSECVGQ